MTDHFLIIDTEASGLPADWSLPYSAAGNWPHAVQISWLIYGPAKEVIKRADHYIRNEGFTITASAIAVHGITPEFLEVNGEPLETVLDELTADIGKYHPLLVGHFIKLDYHILGAEYFRLGKRAPLADIPVFCTMQASAELRGSRISRQLQLNELYYLLFNKEPEKPHNAFFDAQATAECFFELQSRAEIMNGDLVQQDKDSKAWREPGAPAPSGCVPILLLLLLSSLILYFSIS